jgi:hypothetical protein
MTAADGDRQGPAPPFRALLLALPLPGRAVRSFVEIESAQAASSARM